MGAPWHSSSQKAGQSIWSIKSFMGLHFQNDALGLSAKTRNKNSQSIFIQWLFLFNAKRG
jgi:hypothetical protein